MLVGDDQLQETWYAHRDDWQAITNARAIPDRRRQQSSPPPSLSGSG